MRLLLAALLVLAASPALAKPAQCFTTDDGNFPCDFTVTDSQGSFEISAPGLPSYAVLIDSPGIGYGSVYIGRWIPYAEPMRRSTADPACWQNSDSEICAW
jgi:hypothetical protein